MPGSSQTVLTLGFPGLSSLLLNGDLDLDQGALLETIRNLLRGSLRLAFSISSLSCINSMSFLGNGSLINELVLNSLAESAALGCRAQNPRAGWVAGSLNSSLPAMSASRSSRLSPLSLGTITMTFLTCLSTSLIAGAL